MRPPTLLDCGDLAFTLKTPWENVPPFWSSRRSRSSAARVPPARRHLIRDYGILAPHAADRPLLVSGARSTRMTGQSGLRAFADQMALALGQRPEPVEDPPAGRRGGVDRLRQTAAAATPALPLSPFSVALLLNRLRPAGSCLIRRLKFLSFDMYT